mgnify:CR=1 FL=1
MVKGNVYLATVYLEDHKEDAWNKETLKIGEDFINELHKLIRNFKQRLEDQKFEGDIYADADWDHIYAEENEDAT